MVLQVARKSISERVNAVTSNSPFLAIITLFNVWRKCSEFVANGASDFSIYYSTIHLRASLVPRLSSRLVISRIMNARKFQMRIAL